MVKELRDASGSGVMDAKRALEEANGDMKEAAAILRERGLAAAAKRAERETGQGVVDTYIHAGGRIGALVEVNCETDFVANTDEFRTLVHEIAMQVAAMNPAVVSAEDRDAGLEGADDEVALLSQPWVKDGSKTISELVQDSIAKTGENIRVRRFARFELGS
ncbi:MAG: elongation factor Ts [Dehalococcoidia bacterium]|nr:elongation factor Ts [Chloroflexota bacterium]MXW26342.1 elongation factor Ts [Dehalococcoidia bacterium]MXZ88300.1 elongation factor Ts [Dehalococcoidia bacterium]MYA52363.1 elongation factor Ts [Dehalococcoidia bacterium]MYI86250.1 elongation factor Ts [Dehalococcoidia bacterium]